MGQSEKGVDIGPAAQISVVTLGTKTLGCNTMSRS